MEPSRNNIIGISLGWNCHSSMAGVADGIRLKKEDGYKTCPFDTMISNFDGVVECIKDDFAYFTDEMYLQLNSQKRKAFEACNHV